MKITIFKNVNNCIEAIIYIDSKAYTGVGRTQEEAIYNLKKQIDNLISKLQFINYSIKTEESEV